MSRPSIHVLEMQHLSEATLCSKEASESSRMLISTVERRVSD